MTIGGRFRYKRGPASCSHGFPEWRRSWLKILPLADHGSVVRGPVWYVVPGLDGTTMEGASFRYVNLVETRQDLFRSGYRQCSVVGTTLVPVAAWCSRTTSVRQ